MWSIAKNHIGVPRESTKKTGKKRKPYELEFNIRSLFIFCVNK